MIWVEEALDRLLISSEGEILSRIDQVDFEIKIEDTEAFGYCYCIKLDANGNLRLNDLIEFVVDKVVDYAIPKKEIDEARSNPSTAKTMALRRKAIELFTDISKTGEGGEMLLYILAQDILKLPQLISKMSLKTSGQLHYQGVDGIHVKYDQTTNSLVLYWGESKMYKSVSSALKNCFDSLKGYLTDPYSYKSTQERDLQLITANLNTNVNDEKLEDLLVRYFDKDDDLSNNLIYKGICFVGFDSDKYPATSKSKTLAELKAEISTEVSGWMAETKKQLKNCANLCQYEIHVFLIPFPSVFEFRKYFLELLNKK